MNADSQYHARTEAQSGADGRYPFHHRSEIDVDIDAHRLFAHLDDHKRLAGHMEKPSLMLAGSGKPAASRGCWWPLHDLRWEPPHE